MTALNEITSRTDAATFDVVQDRTADAIARAVLEYGAAFMKGALAPEMVSHYRTLLGVDQALTRDRLDPEHMIPLLHRSSRNLLTHHSYSDVADPLGYWFAQSPLADVARGILGTEEIWLELESSYFREGPSAQIRRTRRGISQRPQ